MLRNLNRGEKKGNLNSSKEYSQKLPITYFLENLNIYSIIFHTILHAYRMKNKSKWIISLVNVLVIMTKEITCLPESILFYQMLEYKEIV